MPDGTIAKGDIGLRRGFAMWRQNLLINMKSIISAPHIKPQHGSSSRMQGARCNPFVPAPLLHHGGDTQRAQPQH